MKVKTYSGGSIKGTVSIKLDGVRAHRSGGSWVSRTGKPLYNLPTMPDGVYEVFLGTWEESVSAVRTHCGITVPKTALYSLLPEYDPRLLLSTPTCLTENEVLALMEEVVSSGHEGLVILTNGTFVKVKPNETYDVVVTGIKEGTGRNKGRVGSLKTEMGNVSAGLTDEDRSRTDWVGAVIEVDCMSLTPSGKLRHPRFIRRRYDKE